MEPDTAQFSVIGLKPPERQTAPLQQKHVTVHVKSLVSTIMPRFLLYNTCCLCKTRAEIKFYHHFRTFSFRELVASKKSAQPF